MAFRQTPTRIWTIVQARTGSKRLPGKVLKELPPFPTVLDAVMDRAGRIGYPVCVAVPEWDQYLCHFCLKRGWNYVGGSEGDVLGRYVQAARAVDADHIIRVTADCPFLDVEAAVWTVALHVETGADFTHYVAEGRGVEVFTRDALERSHRDAVTDWEREHVTEHMLQPPNRFKVVRAKFSVDTAEDLETARRRAEWQL